MAIFRLCTLIIYFHCVVGSVKISNQDDGKIFNWINANKRFKGTQTRFEIKILNLIFSFFIFGMVDRDLLNFLSKFESKILNHKQDTMFVS